MGPLLNVGLVARADDRGLGHMTWEFHRHLQPDRVLVVREPGAEARGFTPHLDRYPGATVVQLQDGQLPEAVVRPWLDSLDVVYSAETLYDWRLADWARAARVAVVLHVMPEFHHPDLPDGLHRWAPTPWRLDHLPPGTRLVPVPVAGDRFKLAPPAPADQLRILHVAGHRAAADRNGTNVLLQALRDVHQPCQVRIVTQDANLRRPRSTGRTHVTVTTGGVTDYWDLYSDADVLVLPRRYGGLCLPVQEAMAAGLAVVMPDCSPNDWWPTLRVPVAVGRGELKTPCGPVPLHAASPRAIARLLDRLSTDRQLLADTQAAACAWARAHTWDALAPTYRAELARAAETPASGF